MRSDTYAVEIKRAIRDFIDKLSVVSSRGELNSDGVKAITRIVKMLNRSGMRSEAERLERRLKRGRNLEDITTFLLQLEEELVDRSRGKSGY